MREITFKINIETIYHHMIFNISFSFIRARDNFKASSIHVFQSTFLSVKCSDHDDLFKSTKGTLLFIPIKSIIVKSPSHLNINKKAAEIGSNIQQMKLISTVPFFGCHSYRTHDIKKKYTCYHVQPNCVSKSFKQT